MIFSVKGTLEKPQAVSFKLLYRHKRPATIVGVFAPTSVDIYGAALWVHFSINCLVALAGHNSSESIAESAPPFGDL